MTLEFDKEKMKQMLDAVQFYELNREEILDSTKKAIKYAIELQKTATKEMNGESWISD